MTVNQNELNQFLEYAIQKFYDEGKGLQYESSVDFFKALIIDIQADGIAIDPEMLKCLRPISDEEKYGTLKFELIAPKGTPDFPNPVHIRFRRQDAYGGPKVEDLIDKANSIAAAARRAVILDDNISEKDKQAKIKDINRQLVKVKKDLLAHASFEPEQLKNLNRDDAQTKAYFRQKLLCAEHILGNMADDVAVIASPTPNPSEEMLKKVKNNIFNEEGLMHSGPRPTLITTQQFSLNNTLRYHNHKGQSDYVVVSTTTPQNPQRTISSAQNNGPGIVNWCQNSHQITDVKGTGLAAGTPLATTSSYRSGAPVPYMLLTKNRAFADQVCRGNFQHELLPELARKAMRDGKVKDNQGTADNPIVLKFGLEALLSPRGPIDKKFATNPDDLMVKSIRDAVNYYDGRPIEVMVDGKPTWVQLDAVMLNHGVNKFRNISLPFAEHVEKNINAKGYNQMIDEHIALLNEKGHQNPNIHVQQVLAIYNQLPQFDIDTVKSLNRIDQELRQIYQGLEALELSIEEQNEYLEIEGAIKELIDKNQAVPATITTRFQELDNKLRLQKTAADDSQGVLLKRHAKELEQQKYKLHRRLLGERQAYLKQHHSTLVQNLTHIHDKDLKEFKDHALAFNNYFIAVRKGYDRAPRRFAHMILSKIGISPWKTKIINKQNYNLGKLGIKLHQLAGRDTLFHCKSGKDRTESLDNKILSHTLMELHRQKVAHLKDTQVNHAENEVFDQNFQLGNGNIICGMNMAPSAQQVSAGDLNTHLDISYWCDVAKLQKIDYSGQPHKQKDIDKAWAEKKSPALKTRSAHIDSTFAVMEHALNDIQVQIQKANLDKPRDKEIQQVGYAARRLDTLFTQLNRGLYQGTDDMTDLNEHLVRQVAALKVAIENSPLKEDAHLQADLRKLDLHQLRFIDEFPKRAKQQSTTQPATKTPTRAKPEDSLGIDFQNNLSFDENMANITAYLATSKQAKYRIERHDDPNTQHATIHILDSEGHDTSLPVIEVYSTLLDNQQYHTSIEVTGDMSHDRVKMISLKMLAEMAARNYRATGVVDYAMIANQTPLATALYVALRKKGLNPDFENSDFSTEQVQSIVRIAHQILGPQNHFKPRLPTMRTGGMQPVVDPQTPPPPRPIKGK